MKRIAHFFQSVVNSFALQFAFVTGLVMLAFYKVFSFSFHANREIGWLIPIIGNDISVINLMRSHGFINIINYWVYGANPAGWYLAGVLFHIASTCMFILFVNTLTRQKLLSFLVGIWFAISLSWHDVITFGSQESVYAFQLFLFFIGILFFKKFRDTSNKKFYVLSLVTFFILPPLRESGLFFFLILFAYDVIFYISSDFRKREYHTIFHKSVYWVPFLTIIIFFVTLRSHYGGSPNDFSDERVKLAHKLIEEREFIPYIKYGVLAFGSYIPPHFIPYNFINSLRRAVLLVLDNHLLKLLFFPSLGYIFYLLLFVGVWVWRKTKIIRLLVFSIALITIPTLFYSFAFTTDEPFYLRDYGYDENRWRYVAFCGTSLYLILFFREFLKKMLKNQILRARVIGIIVVTNLILNILLLWQTQQKMYDDMFRSQKLFYSSFLKLFPTYAKETILYTFPYSYQLGDYLWEWYFLKEFYYKNLSSLRTDWTYGEMEKVLQLIKKEPSAFQHLYFIDFDPGFGVVDYTQLAKKEIREQKTVVLPILSENSNGLHTLPVKNISPVEFPYNAEIRIKADLYPMRTREKKQDNVPDREKLTALVAYAKSHEVMMTRKVKEVCRTRGNMLMFDPSHLADGNYGNRSVWWADCIPGWFILDLGEEYDLSGFIMGGIKDDPLLPQTYTYEVSQDAKRWTKVLIVSNNTRWEMLDKWPKNYTARYVRVSVAVTQKGGFVMIDEAEPVLAEANEVFTYWSSRTELFDDFQKLHSYLIDRGLSEFPSYTLGKFSWKTNLTNIPQEQTRFYFPITVDGQYHTYTIPIYESENYSLHGQFLRRFIQEVSLDFRLFPGSVTVDNVALKPRIPLPDNE